MQTLRFTRPALRGAVFAAFAFGTCSLASAQRLPAPAAPDYAEHEVLVVYKDAVGDPSRSGAPMRIGGHVVQTLAEGRMHRVLLPAHVTLAQAIATLNRDPEVAYAEPNYKLYAHATTPNDTYFTDLWGMQNTGQIFASGVKAGKSGADIHAVNAWDLTTGAATTIVADIDTGIDYNHPDLIDNVWTNPSPGTYNDIHGIKHNSTYDSATNTLIPNISGDPFDDAGHGTHTAGTMGATGNNSLGVVGVNWTVKIIAAKFLDKNGSGYTSDAISCIDYLNGLKDEWTSGAKDANGNRLGADIVVMNNSWGGGGFDQSLKDAIQRANTRGILFVCSAGNASNDNDKTPTYPASYGNSNIIVVEATDANDTQASFSNYGKTSVNIGAPGVNIASTVPTAYWTSRGYTGVDPYAYFSGTSMAAPHVSGAIALLHTYLPLLTASQLKTRILNSGDPIAALWHKTATGRRLNIDNALRAVYPASPTEYSVTLAVKSDKTSYTLNTAATITVTAKIGTKVAASLPIAFTVTRPDATTYSVTKNTNSLGVVVLSYTKTDKTGTYKVSVVASKTYYNSTPATVSFTVK